MTRSPTGRPRRRGEDTPRERPLDIRVLPELRSEQVTHHLEFTPAEALYFGTNFDLVGIEVPPGMRRSSLLKAMFRIAATPAEVLELPEPLWARFLPRTTCLALAWTLSGLLRGRWRRARTYAIENNDPLTALLGDRRTGPMTGRLVKLALGALIVAMFERIAYGSQIAADSYRSLPFVRRVEHRVFLELPARPEKPSPVAPVPHTAVFVGELAPRKGVETLLQAWALVETNCPQAQLHVVGSGPLEAEVQRWAAERHPSRRFHGHLSHRQVLQLLPTFSVLAAPSVRWSRWREQIGLPIKEALRSGLTVVTTTETGLATWLHSHGHRVLGSPVHPQALSEALSGALADPLPREQVLADLPSVSSRLEADLWLHTVQS